MASQFDFNVCGEGGEYETAVFDCPLFKTHRIVSTKQEVVMHEDNPICSVAYLRYLELALEEKSPEDQAAAEKIMKELIDKRS